MNRTELAKNLYRTAYITGTFKLRSGTTSNEYFDKYRFEAQPNLLRAIAKELAPLIPPRTEILAGLEMGGIPIATALSLESGIPCVFVRKEAKAYGTCQLAEGLDINGKKVCVIEDVITTGGQVIISTKDLRERGAIINNILCVLLRGEPNASWISELGINLNWLFTMDEIKS